MTNLMGAGIRNSCPRNFDQSRLIISHCLRNILFLERVGYPTCLGQERSFIHRLDLCVPQQQEQLFSLKQVPLNDFHLKVTLFRLGGRPPCPTIITSRLEERVKCLHRTYSTETTILVVKLSSRPSSGFPASFDFAI